jgi:transcriptional regulator with XRE-family HTH domain
MDTPHPKLRIRTDALDRLRVRHQLTTVRALAEAIGYDPGGLSRVLRGEKGLGVTFIERLCGALGAQVGELFEIDFTPAQTGEDSDPDG